MKCGNCWGGNRWEEALSSQHSAFGHEALLRASRPKNTKTKNQKQKTNTDHTDLTDRTDLCGNNVRSYDVLDMRRWRVAVVVVVLIVAVVAAFQWYSRRAQRKRDAQYQSALFSYSHQFPLGASREVVESYLRARGIAIQQQSGETDFDAMTDLIVIGHDPVPWYCSSSPVYIEFHFHARQQDHQFKADSSDILKNVRLDSRGEGCL